MRVFNILLLVVFVIFTIIISHGLGQQAYDWLPISATKEAELVGHLFSFLVTLGSGVFFGVLGILFYSILFYRANRNDNGDAPPIRGNLKLEITWTVIPILLVIWIAGYSYNIYQRMNTLGSLAIVNLPNPLVEPAYAQTDRSDALPDEEIEVTVKQWSWSFRYPTRNITSDELHLPLNRRIRLLMTSEDVLHGFYVPNFRIKQDIVPNRTIELKFTPNRVGKYQLHDSQFSGTYFALMEADVYVDSSDAYSQWLTELATRQPTSARILSNDEHKNPPETPLKSSWPTVSPAKPPMVHPVK